MVLTAATPDRGSAKDTSTPADRAQNEGKKHESHPLNNSKEEVANGSQIIREFLEVQGIFKRAGISPYNIVYLVLLDSGLHFVVDSKLIVYSLLYTKHWIF